MPPKARSRDRLLDRIGAPEGVRLKRVSSDNHHIVIKTTDNQVYRELMRLRDAVADIDVEPGICVHRSHWVALSQITAVETTDGREHVSMPCGCKLPVGPKYRSNLVEVGKLSA
nr:LytTR family DNA-binding domain-containing protein [Octadecabacter algicola]